MVRILIFGSIIKNFKVILIFVIMCFCYEFKCLYRNSVVDYYYNQLYKIYKKKLYVNNIVKL